MFADFAGVAGLIKAVGAQAAVDRLAPAVGRLVAAVRARSGSIHCIVDGSAIAVFGLNTVDGHGATQAIGAGRAFLAAAAEDGALPGRVGIECGEVVVSRSWEPARFAVWGDTVTAARQLRDAAHPGAMLLGPRAGGPVGDAHRCIGADPVDTARAERRRPRRVVLGSGGPQRSAGVTLTRAEMAVARLVAEGLSNPQIAGRLYISRHTAETHLKHIFTKLGLSSRAELAARVASHTVGGVV